MSNDEGEAETETKNTNSHLRGYVTHELNALQATSKVECDFGQYK